MLPAQMIKPRQILAQFIGENFGLDIMSPILGNLSNSCNRFFGPPQPARDQMRGVYRKPYPS